MNTQINYLTSFIFTLFWTAGAVTASGFWSTLLAVFFPPWAFYLTVEQILIHYTPFLG